MKEIFKENKKDMCGSFQFEITTSFEKLKKLFWEPISTWDKVSTQWNLTYLPKNINFYIYDYKETNLYDDTYPTVEEFRAKKQYDWHIGWSKDLFNIRDELIYFLSWD